MTNVTEYFRSRPVTERESAVPPALRWLLDWESWLTLALVMLFWPVISVALGKLRPGQRRVFRWSVTAVKAGPYRLEYTVSAGLDGKAKAVDSSGRTPTGRFAGTVSGAAPATRVADDGRTIVRGTR